VLYSFMTSETYGVLRSIWSLWLDTYQGVCYGSKNFLLGSLYKGYNRFAGAAPELDAIGPYRLDDCFVY
jgi:hypothetical protein